MCQISLTSIKGIGRYRGHTPHTRTTFFSLSLSKGILLAYSSRCSRFHSETAVCWPERHHRCRHHIYTHSLINSLCWHIRPVYFNLLYFQNLINLQFFLAPVPSLILIWRTKIKTPVRSQNPTDSPL